MAINPVDGAALVWVRPDSFVMGSDAADVRRLWAQNGWGEALFAGHVGGADWVGEPIKRKT